MAHVHHRTYSRLFNELPTDLEGLCEYCHEQQHGLRTNNGSQVVARQEQNKEDQEIRSAGRAAERLRQIEKSEWYLSYAGKGLADAEVAKMFRKTPTLFYWWSPHR